MMPKLPPTFAKPAPPVPPTPTTTITTLNQAITTRNNLPFTSMMNAKPLTTLVAAIQTARTTPAVTFQAARDPLPTTTSSNPLKTNLKPENLNFDGTAPFIYDPDIPNLIHETFNTLADMNNDINDSVDSLTSADEGINLFFR